MKKAVPEVQPFERMKYNQNSTHIAAMLLYLFTIYVEQTCMVYPEPPSKKKKGERISLLFFG